MLQIDQFVSRQGARRSRRRVYLDHVRNIRTNVPNVNSLNTGRYTPLHPNTDPGPAPATLFPAIVHTYVLMLRLHNTLTGSKDVFEPLGAEHVRMYTCGPTVWNFAHVGNLRAFLFYDLVRRHLRASGFRVTHVMNLTDIDDRILDQAMHAGTTISDYTRPYEEAFFEDMATLRAERAEHYPRATEHIPEMIAMISTLIANGNAYVADGDVYFRLASFPSYGELSHLDRAGLKAGARVATDKYEKE